MRFFRYLNREPEQSSDMTVIIGLGNPEKDYSGTRHNVGFDVINTLSEELKIPIDRSKHRAHLGMGARGNKKIILAKPTTYMNLSGECAREVLRFYKLTPQSVIIIYDDCDIALGSVRIRERGSAGGHNGIKSLIYHLNTDEFIRIRVGIGARPPKMPLDKYVLSRFDKDEQEQLSQGINQAVSATISILDENAVTAMNKFN